MAEKKSDFYNKGKIYIGMPFEVPLSGAISFDKECESYTSYEVIGEHSFKDGQDVTGLYRIDVEDANGAIYPTGNLTKVAIALAPPDELDMEVKELVEKFAMIESGGIGITIGAAEKAAIIHCELMIKAYGEPGIGIVVNHYQKLIKKIESL